MRIGLISNSFLPLVGGVEWKVHYLATEYVRHGHSVTVFHAQLPRACRGPLPVTPSYEVVPVGPPPLPGTGRLGIINWALSSRVLRAHREEPIDVLHCHSLAFATAAGARVKRIANIPVAATPCGDDVLTVPSIGFGVRLVPQYDRMVRRNLQEIDLVGSISGAVRRELESAGTRARIVDIPNGVDWDQFQTGPSRWLHERLGLTRQAVIILSLGRNHAEKGYATGLRAFARVAARVPHAHYAIVGTRVPTLRPLVEELNLAGRVHLLDSVPMAEVPRVLRSADIFFSPSVQEGFAQVVAQAIVCGRPLVVSDCSGNEDLQGREYAIVARTGDATAMAAALETLASDPARRTRMGATAEEDGRQYAWSLIAERYLEHLEELASGLLHLQSPPAPMARFVSGPVAATIDG